MTIAFMRWFRRCAPIRMVSSTAVMMVSPSRRLLVALFMLVAFTLYIYPIPSRPKPTLYDTYAPPDVPLLPLKAKKGGFILNGINFTILSGEIHYFRVHPGYWRDSLRKLRACGLNTVSTYIPWNLHNPAKGQYDFGGVIELLDIEKFVMTAKEEDLFVILKPGPYIGADVDFGGLPSWLLTYPEMKVRSLNEGFMTAVEEYFSVLMPKLYELQFIKGGPIIAFQLESNYDVLFEADEEYLEALSTIMTFHGIESLVFTTDSVESISMEGRPNAILKAITVDARNARNDVKYDIELLREIQGDLPVYIGKLNTGVFSHHAFAKTFARLVLQLDVSINLYVFHGGTNWGFINGATEIQTFPFYFPYATSYDYSAPLTESGDYGGKYAVVRSVLSRLQAAPWSPQGTALPGLPPESYKMVYGVQGSLRISKYMSFNQLVDKVDIRLKTRSVKVVPMEDMDISLKSGQSFGFTVYRKTNVVLLKPTDLQVMGCMKDVGMVLLDGWRQTDVFKSLKQARDFGYWLGINATITLRSINTNSQTLDIMVENWGRIGGGISISDFDQKKGILVGPVLLDGIDLVNWEIIALDFNQKWINSLTDWSIDQDNLPDGPALYKCSFYLYEMPIDTYIDMRGWVKGVVFVNGFNIGRYFHLDAVKTLYVPKHLLRIGQNEIIVFEMYETAGVVTFSSVPLFSRENQGQTSRHRAQYVCYGLLLYILRYLT